ncbi:MAG TPA: hypothetical protein VEF76_04090, partial [Patescibacteria group bacterium]|nr:hypothetical protein [Patescibacteria group bacterium]
MMFKPESAVVALAIMIGVAGLSQQCHAAEQTAPAPAGEKAAAEKQAAPDIPAMFQRSGLTVSAPAFEGTAAAEPPKFPPPEDLKKKADAGDAAAMRAIGEFYHDGKESDWSAAHGWFMKAAEKGDVDAWYYAGRDFWGSHGVPRDIPKALEWLGKAADAGQPRAQSLLGEILKKGERDRAEVMAVEPDLKRAIPLLEKA